MLRAEDKARQGGQKTGRGRGKSRRRAAGDRPVAGRQVARGGLEAVEATERMICGAGVVRSAPVAQGLALAGRRAAVLPATDGSTPGSDATSVRAAWVEHRVGGPVEVGGMAFTLVAGSAQEAVDHCLVAQRVAGKLGRPGLCEMDPSIAGTVHLLRLPDPETVEALLHDAGPAARSTDPTAEIILGAAREAFEAVTLHTDRPHSAVAMHRMRDARHALLASGPWREEALVLADILRAASVPCGVVEIALIRPFPGEELERVLRGLETIVVLSDADTARDLAAGVRRLDAVRSARLVELARKVPGETGALDVGRVLGLAEESLAALEGPSEAQEAPGVRVLIGALPAGLWSDRFLLDAAALIAGSGALAVERAIDGPPWASALVLRRGPAPSPPGPGFDLLFAAHPECLDGAALDAVRSGGTVVLHAGAGTPEELWRGLTRAQRARLLEREIDLRWIDSSAAALDVVGALERTRLLLLGSFLAGGPVARVTGGDDPLAVLIGAAERDVSLEESELLRRGAEAAREIELHEVDAAAQRVETDFRVAPPLPRMPALAEPDASWSEKLWSFHVSGEGAHSAIDPLPSLPLRPALLANLSGTEDGGRGYPLVVAEGSSRGLHGIIETTLDGMERDGEPAPILREHRTRLVHAAGMLVERHGGTGSLPELLAHACDLFLREFDLSKAGRAALQEEIERFRSRMPEAGELVGLSEQTPLALYRMAVEGQRAGPRAEFLKETTGLVERLQELLRLDARHAPESSTAGALAPSLGDKGGGFVDPDALSGHLPRQRGSKRLEPRRRERIERTLGVLRRYLDEASSLPRLVLLHPRGTRPATIPGGVRLVEHPEPLRAAVGWFDGHASRMGEVFAAARTARLEVRSQYDAELHDATLARFDWRLFNRDELCLLPAVVVLEDARRLRGPSLAALSELLRSGRPLHVLIPDTALAERSGDAWSTMAEQHPGLGYLALAHRETYALQATLARPGHLVEGLRRMMLARSPAVAVVAVPSRRAPVPPEVQLAAALEGRVTPCFGYDAEAGASWATRFDVSANPQPAAIWPVHRSRHLDYEENEQVGEEAFTFAHAAALDPECRKWFRVIPVEAWNDEQVPLAQYLAAPERWKQALPFIWVVTDDGDLARAVVTRDLVLACLDRARAWRILQELAGEDNEYARRAAEAAREEALAEARRSREQLEAAHAEMLEEARSRAVGEAVDRVVRVLMDLDTLPAVEGAPPRTAPAAAEPAKLPEPRPAEKDVEEEEVSFDEPYIDQVLCTTCNECTNINPQLFKYNENKQAYIADPSAGTFKQLVLAAEKCPARCIHPGKPRKDDATATEKMIARAARFN